MKTLVVGITGKALAGKTSIAKALSQHLHYDLGGHHTYNQIVSLADPLKDQCAQITGLPRAWFDDPIYKETLRPLMQWWGTEFKRNPLLGGYHDYWVDLMGEHIANLSAVTEEMIQTGDIPSTVDASTLVVIIPDVRFDNEGLMLKNSIEYGTLINIEALNAPSSPNATHVSEKGVSPDLFTFTYHNDHAVGPSEIVRIAEEIFDTYLAPNFA